MGYVAPRVFAGSIHSANVILESLVPLSDIFDRFHTYNKPPWNNVEAMPCSIPDSCVHAYYGSFGSDNADREPKASVVRS